MPSPMPFRRANGSGASSTPLLAGLVVLLMGWTIGIFFLGRDTAGGGSSLSSAQWQTLRDLADSSAATTPASSANPSAPSAAPTLPVTITCTNLSVTKCNSPASAMACEDTLPNANDYALNVPVNCTWVATEVVRPARFDSAISWPARLAC